MRRILLLIICILVLNRAHTFKAKLTDLSVDGEIHVTCQAELSPVERFKGPLTLKIEIQQAESAEVSKATWKSASGSTTGVENAPSFQEGDLCDDVPFCIKHKESTPFSSARRFTCYVNDNGVVAEDRNLVVAEGTYCISLHHSFPCQ